VNPHQWQPDKPAAEVANIAFATAPDGRYRLALGLFTDPDRDSPDYLFASEGSTPDRWLVLGRVWLTSR
jgi:hypothetical protein